MRGAVRRERIEGSRQRNHGEKEKNKKSMWGEKKIGIYMWGERKILGNLYWEREKYGESFGGGRDRKKEFGNPWGGREKRDRIGASIRGEIQDWIS